MKSRLIAVTIFIAGTLLLTGCLGGVQRVSRGILARDATWRGRVEVTGVVLVERDVHLRIEPGTEVVFTYLDEDGDGIGDGELNVLGTLTAVGTSENPIIFRSAAGRKKDWTFLHLSGNNASRIENCIFRDAFTGIQLHYVNIVVQNCLFANNHEGLRYSTIRGHIRHNDFVNNTVGIRFEGRQSRVQVENNLFQGNETAVFPVEECSPEDRFRNNNFLSLGYNVKLGLNQTGDLDFSDNYWGASNLEAVLDSIFDGHVDKSLGIVRVEPFLPKPVPGAGIQKPLYYEIQNSKH